MLFCKFHHCRVALIAITQQEVETEIFRIDLGVPLLQRARQDPHRIYHTNYNITIVHSPIILAPQDNQGEETTLPLQDQDLLLLCLTISAIQLLSIRLRDLIRLRTIQAQKIALRAALKFLRVTSLNGSFPALHAPAQRTTLRHRMAQPRLRLMKLLQYAMEQTKIMNDKVTSYRHRVPYLVHLKQPLLVLPTIIIPLPVAQAY